MWTKSGICVHRVWTKLFDFLPLIDRESTDRCFLYACYGNPAMGSACSYWRSTARPALTTSVAKCTGNYCATSWRDSTISAPVSVCHRRSYAERDSKYRPVDGMLVTHHILDKEGTLVPYRWPVDTEFTRIELAVEEQWCRTCGGALTICDHRHHRVFTLTGPLHLVCKHAHWFCRKVRFLGQNPKIGYQKFNDLQTAKISKKQLCDRTLPGADASADQRTPGAGHVA